MRRAVRFQRELDTGWAVHAELEIIQLGENEPKLLHYGFARYHPLVALGGNTMKTTGKFTLFI
jgi:hypothetical protein